MDIGQEGFSEKSSVAKEIEALPQSKNFLISISLQPEGVNLCYFEYILFDLIEFIV